MAIGMAHLYTALRALAMAENSRLGFFSEPVEGGRTVGEHCKCL